MRLKQWQKWLLAAVTVAGLTGSAVYALDWVCVNCGCRADGGFLRCCAYVN
jgi:hypothetical protein